jgi:hypothetical protein
LLIRALDGISRELLAKPIVGIAMTLSAFNNRHRQISDLVKQSPAACSPQERFPERCSGKSSSIRTA